jgi:ubiquinone/menaquinone biosynthesis C-methylase UbiE
MLMDSDLGETTTLDAMESFRPVRGLRLLDIGCGDLGFTRQLSENAKSVIGVDPDPVQSEKNRAMLAKADAPPNLTFVESSADELPVESDSVDGVCFSFSLHHIPSSAYKRVFDEVRRVLVPGGFLCVIEPMDSPLNQIMRLFHDEDHERQMAQQALREMAEPLFGNRQTRTFHNFIAYESFEQFAVRFASRSFNSLYSEADVRNSSVQAAFERHAPDYRFFSPKCLAYFVNSIA